MKKYKLEIEFTKEDLELLNDIFCDALNLCEEYKEECIIREHDGSFERIDFEQKSKDIENFAKFIKEHLTKVEEE